MLSHMMMGNWASLRWVELAPSEQMFEVVHYKKGSSFLVFNKQLAPFGIPSFYWRWRCIVNDVNIIVNVLLGIRYFFTHRAFFAIILRVIQLVNMIVNALLGIRYFFTHRALVPIRLRAIQLVNMIVNIVLGIRYFSPIVPSSPFFWEVYSWSIWLSTHY